MPTRTAGVGTTMPGPSAHHAPAAFRRQRRFLLSVGQAFSSKLRRVPREALHAEALHHLGRGYRRHAAGDLDVFDVEGFERPRGVQRAALRQQLPIALVHSAAGSS